MIRARIRTLPGASSSDADVRESPAEPVNCAKEPALAAFVRASAS
jgi:hypothetical protein